MSEKPKLLKTIGDVDDIVCPVCGAKSHKLEFIEEGEEGREIWRCPLCRTQFVVGWTRELEYVWWKDEKGVEHETWNSNTIIVEVMGGVVEVHKPGHLSHVKVIVRDYDIEGADEDDLTQDPDGRECREEEI